MRKLRITIGNQSWDVTVEDLTDPAMTHPVAATPPHAAAPPSTSLPAAAGPRAVVPAGQGQVVSPMAGTILSVLVEVGTNVTQGQPLVVLEAMKMENHVAAPVAGRVKSIAVSGGDQVAEGQVLVELE